MEKLFIFAIMWSFGALLETGDREKLQEFLLAHGTFQYPPLVKDQTIFEYFVDNSGRLIKRN